jgi:acetoin utilization deacetylase AcuC-like enzyme
LDRIHAVHDPAYVESVERICARGGGVLDYGDTGAGPDSYDTALLAAGGVIAAARAIHEGTVASAFAAVRPPGHHAEKDRAMGFCLFNNVAVGAVYCLQKLGCKRVLIVDWDVHHGNGTQHIFEESDSVFYFSIHQYPHYPGTGRESETGRGKGEGYTLNVPMPATAGDDEYFHAFQERLYPAMELFRPDFIFISAGFDAHRDDPLSAIRVSEEGYAEMTRMIKALQGRYGAVGILSVLEGGYNLRSLSASVRRHIEVLQE